MMKRGIRAAVLFSILISASASRLCAGETMKLVPSHPLAKVLRGPVQTAPADSVLRLDGAPGETISAQAVLSAGDTPDRVTAAISDLQQAGATAKIPAQAATLQWVRYLDITKNTQGIPENELVAQAPVSIPDPFWEDHELAVEAKATQPLWIEITVAPDTAPGEYRGTLSVTGRTGRVEMPMSLRVRRFRLPEERHQKVIQWWDFPGRGFEGLKPDSDAYWKHLERSCEMLRSHRQTDVRVTWEMITPKSTADGKPQWDTAFLEKHTDTIFKAGLRAVQFTGLGRHTKFQLEQDSRTEAVEDNLGRLAALQELVVRRGWQGRVLTSLADEPFIYHEQSYHALLERVRKIAPAVGVIEAVETDDIGDIDIFVPKLSHLNLWLPCYESLKRQQKEVWFYTCCHPVGRYPNRFLDQPLVKARELHWISYLCGLDGYLHWGFNWFKASGDPYSEDGANPWALPPGDSQVAYPGKNGFVGSLRLSAMRDGLQDYEYLWTLEDRLRQLKQRLGNQARWLDPRQRPLELCRRVVQSCYEHTRDPQTLLATRSVIADEIEALAAKPLLVVQTSPPEATATPAGPTMINIRGVTTPGAKVTINGKQVIPQNVSSDGCFIDAQFITRGKGEISVTAELDGRTSTARRTFRVLD
jgi:hypothetical protein